MPLHQSVFGYADGSGVVALIPPELLPEPRVGVSTEPQTTLRFPLFNGTNKTLNAVLTSIDKVFLVLDDLTNFTNKGVVVTDHSLKTIIFMDVLRPTVM